MVVVSCSIRGWCYSGWWVWSLRPVAHFRRWNIPRVVPRLYGWVCEILRPATLPAEDSVVVVTASYQLGVS